MEFIVSIFTLLLFPIFHIIRHLKNIKIKVDRQRLSKKTQISSKFILFGRLSHKDIYFRQDLDG